MKHPDPSNFYGRLPLDGPTDLAATLDRISEAALFGLPLIHLPMPFDPTRPSAVRVFGKSMHVLALGWMIAVVWLWVAGVQQHMLREGGMPADYGLPLLAFGAVIGMVLEAAALPVTRWTGRAPNQTLERREWRHAFWWSLVPNAMLWATVYLMIASAY